MCLKKTILIIIIFLILMKKILIYHQEIGTYGKHEGGLNRFKLSRLHNPNIKYIIF